MKFGKLSDISEVNFSFPAEPERNAALLTDLPPVKTSSVYIGCTGWSMREWVGKVYPKGTKAGDYLLHYGKQFNTIELNSTHYRIPDETTIDKWRNTVPEDFRFCPKIPQTISHQRFLGRDENWLNLFTERIRGLEDRLGCCFLQLPPYFGPDRLELLADFLNRFPQDIPLAVEARHADFFATEEAAESFFRLLGSFDRTAVITDVAGRRDVLHLALTNARTMIRFVGNGLHETDYERIDAWVELLAKWTANGLPEVYFFPHEPDNILAPDLSVYLLSRLQEVPGLSVRGPKLIDDQAGQQISLF